MEELETPQSQLLWLISNLFEDEKIDSAQRDELKGNLLIRSPHQKWPCSRKNRS